MKSALAFGVDIGGTRTKIAVVDIFGNVIDRKIISMSEYRKISDYNRFITSLCECILYFSAQLDNKEILGIGIGAPNADHRNMTIANPANLWHCDQNRIFELGNDLRRELTKNGLSDINLKMSNDANTAALGEMFFGGAKELSNFMVVTLGTGVGGGIVLNRRLIEGSNSQAGEIGHMKIEHTDRLCGCGMKGCLESYVSAGGICRTAIEWLYSKKYNSSIEDIPIEKLSCLDICNAAKNGDQMAQALFEFTGKLLGTKLADVISLLDIEAIFLTGGVAKANELILNPVKRAVNDSLPSRYHNIKIEISEINDDFAAARGAATMIFFNP